MKNEALRSCRVLVVGLGVTGLSVVRYLVRQQIQFDVADECDESAAEHHRCHLTSLCKDFSIPQLYSQFDEATFATYDVIVISPGVPRSHPAIVFAIASGADVIGDIELFAREVEVPVIAVTGSNGKSTVVSWLAFALRQADVKAVACGNIGKPALDSLDLDAEVLVLELSSYQLESTSSLKALAGVVLNVSDDHLDRYNDIDHYASVKRRLLNMSEHVIVNLDDKRTWPVNTEADSCEFFTISVNDVEQSARWRRCIKDSVVYLCDAGQLLVDESELCVPGEHNVANALAVLALCTPLDIGFEKLRSGLTSYKGLPHRSQFIGERYGVRWYNDSKGTNVDACEKALLAMPGPVLLIAGGMSKGADFSPLNETLHRLVKLLILIGQDREQMAVQMTGAPEIVMADSLVSAVSIANQSAQAGDVVLLSPACSSFDMFRDFEDRGEQFIAAVEEVLAA